MSLHKRAVGGRPLRPALCAPSLQRAHRDWSCSRSTSQRAPASSCRRWTRSTGAFGGGRGQGMPDGNKSSASRLSLSAMLPQATCSQPSRRGLQQASSARHSAEGVPGMDALGGRMDTCLQVVNARPDAQSRCRRAARSRTEAVVVWSTCHERVGMPEHPVSATSLAGFGVGTSAAPEHVQARRSGVCCSGLVEVHVGKASAP